MAWQITIERTIKIFFRRIIIKNILVKKEPIKKIKMVFIPDNKNFLENQKRIQHCRKLSCGNIYGQER